MRLSSFSIYCHKDNDIINIEEFAALLAELEGE